MIDPRVLHFVQIISLQQIQLKTLIETGLSLTCRMISSPPEQTSQTTSATSSNDISLEMQAGTENISLCLRNGLEMVVKRMYDLKVHFITPRCF